MDNYKSELFHILKTEKDYFNISCSHNLLSAQRASLWEHFEKLARQFFRPFGRRPTTEFLVVHHEKHDAMMRAIVIRHSGVRSVLERSSPRLQFWKRLASSSVILHYDYIRPSNQTDEPPVVVLHGLLGHSRNVRTLANKVAEQYQVPCLVMDVRGHGESKGRNDPNVTTTLSDCVQDIAATLDAAGVTDPGITIMGHSLGGRLAMEYVARHMKPEPRHIWLLDTVPGNIHPSVVYVLDVATKIVQNPQEVPSSRSELTQLLVSQYKLDRATAQWLASSYADGEFQFDLSVAHDLVHDLNQQDFTGYLSDALHHQESPLRIDMIRGSRNSNWSSSTWETLQSWQGPHFQLHTVDAGHWVHIDDLPGVMSTIASVPRRTT